MKSRTIWWTVGTTGLISTLVFAGGFGYAVKDVLFPSAVQNPIVTAPQETAAPSGSIETKEKVQLVTLGDSLTAGTGDGTGKGYVGRFREKLQTQLNKPVYVLNNLAIPGATTTALLKEWDQKKTTDALKQADLILLTIGGNDIFQGGTGIFDNATQEFNPDAAAKRVEPTLVNLKKILADIHQANPDATVMYIGLYHPFLDLDEKKAGSLIVQKFNDAAFALTNQYPNMIFVPTYDLFERNLNKYLFTDHFHPNQDGYERIAERMAQILK
ncbi:GDSL-type esterase/lipase family protein [Paenibacillus sp. FJAT-26967]|uniref:GDSL-type esterase/lipase family protein n=1 Tax=Paenibacillus sp. FJAT-26967 TaxID=1729690 RepID=UPI000839578E|nr:GDSL-type esterase/lipase family protein [Paenibacillus sp. FJAT-26967]